MVNGTYKANVVVVTLEKSPEMREKQPEMLTGAWSFAKHKSASILVLDKYSLLYR